MLEQSKPRPSVDEAIRETLQLFGKVGIVVDDVIDAELRVGRELYGTDGLPAWWLHYDTQESLRLILEACDSILSKDYQPPILMVVDRYLPENDTIRRPQPWDQVEDLRDRLSKLIKEHRSFKAIGLTSYCGPPQQVEDATPGHHEPAEWGLEWRARHLDPLIRERRNLRLGLLWFGSSRGDRDGRVLHKVVNRLSSDEHICVLLTGAGASFSNHPLGPGMPTTDFLLDWSCWRATSVGDEPQWPETAGGRPLGSAWKFAHEGRPTKGGDDRKDGRKKVRSVAELLEKYRQGKTAKELSWKLEELFEMARVHDQDGTAEFIGHFRRAMQRYDHSTPSQMWLAAQLPWSLIMTTNFDCFHERAAAMAARTDSNGVLAPASVRLGELLDNRIVGDYLNSETSITDWPGLYKPYGSLMASSQLTLDVNDLNNKHDRFKAPLDAIAEKQPAAEKLLVVLGHAVGLESFQLLLRTADRHGFEVLWVDPNASRSALLDALNRDRGKSGKRKNHGPHTLPVTALEFCHDLWWTYHSEGPSGPDSHRATNPAP